MQTNGLVEDQERDASLPPRSNDQVKAPFFNDLFTNSLLNKILIPFNIHLQIGNNIGLLLGGTPRRIMLEANVNKWAGFTRICRTAKRGRRLSQLVRSCWLLFAQ